MKKTLLLIILLAAFASKASAIILAGVMGGTTTTTYAPNAPTSPSATAGDSQNTITWTASTTDGTHSAPTQYNLLWGLSAGSEPNTISNITSGYIHSGLTNGSTYYYKVQAQNSGGTASSSEVSAAPASSGGGGGTTWTFTGSVTNSSNWTTWTGGAGSATASANGMNFVNGSTVGDYAGMKYNSSFSMPSGSQTMMWRAKVLTASSVSLGQNFQATLWQGSSVSFPGTQSGTANLSYRRLIAVLNDSSYAATYTLANGGNVNGSGSQITANSSYYIYFLLTATQSRVVVTTSASVATDGTIGQTFSNILADSGVVTIGGSGMTNDGSVLWFQMGNPWTDTTEPGTFFVQEVYNHTY